MDNIKKHIGLCLSTFFYVGLISLAPGTMGSVAATILFYFMPLYVWWSWLGMALGLFIVGILASDEMERRYGLKDPSWIVIDEVFGMSCILPFVQKNFFAYLLALVLFRFFDIVKPFPIRWVEQNVAGGLGIMLDDFIAALMALGVLSLILFFTKI